MCRLKCLVEHLKLLMFLFLRQFCGYVVVSSNGSVGVVGDPAAISNSSSSRKKLLLLMIVTVVGVTLILFDVDKVFAVESVFTVFEGCKRSFGSALLSAFLASGEGRKSIYSIFSSTFGLAVLLQEYCNFKEKNVLTFSNIAPKCNILL